MIRSKFKANDVSSAGRGPFAREASPLILSLVDGSLSDCIGSFTPPNEGVDRLLEIQAKTTQYYCSADQLMSFQFHSGSESRLR